MERNPLARLPLPTGHPSSPTSSPLSSVLDDPDAFLSLQQRVDERLHDYVPLNSGDKTASFLKVFRDSLSKAGRAILMTEILQLDDAELRVLRAHVIDAVLTPMKATSGQTPAEVTSHPSEEVEVETQTVMGDIESSTCKDQKWLRTQCLKRDGYKCQVSGFYDKASVMQHSELREEVERTDSVALHTECCHIVPFYLGSFDEDNITAVESKSITWNALTRYFPEIKGIVSAETVNSPRNAITLAKPLHDLFGSFHFTFGATDKETTYKLVHSMWHREYEVVAYFPQTMTVSFSSADPAVEMPSQILLKVHERIARIMDVSGLSRQYDALTELAPLDRRVASDGSTDIPAAIRHRLLICS